MWALRVATVAGIDIKVHATFSIIVALSALQWRAHGPLGLLFGTVSSLAVFTCIALHELGHSLVAQAFGIRVREILLFPLGGVAKMEGEAKRPYHEVLIALAGPAVNVVIAAVLVTGLSSGFDPTTLEQAAIDLSHGGPPSEIALAMTVAASNAFLALFNLIPAFPMDGGRVLRAVLSWVMPPKQATQVAVWLGRVLALVMVGAGVVLGFGFEVMALRTLPLVGVFVLVAGWAELEAIRFREVLSGIRLRDVVNPYAPRLHINTPLTEAVQALVVSPLPAFAVEHFGRLAGVVTREAVIAAAKDAGSLGYVAAIMRRDVPRLPADATLEEARTVMQSHDVTFVAVEHQGAFLGLATEAELAHQVHVMKALRSRPVDGFGTPV
jgi:Zn-dependent protease